MDVGAGLSTLGDTHAAAMDAAMAARSGMSGQADLAVVFASPHHAGAAERVVEAVYEAAGPRALMGCVAEAVVGGPREVEGGPGISVWLGRLPGGAATFHATFHRTSEGVGFLGLPNLDQRSGTMLVVCDPFTFPADLLLREVNESGSTIAVAGGMASGARQPGNTVLFHDRSVVRDGAVGALLPGANEIRTLVSQGCRPIGRSFVVTRARENVLFELAGRPPLERLRETVATLPVADRELLTGGLQLGRVIDEYKVEYGLGDFLIRGVVGVEPESGALEVGDHLVMGQTVQFHIRDAASADEELRTMLERSMAGMRGRPAGALLFTCNGRGTRMFSSPDHDARLVSSYLGDAPMAGFFCAGELGPVGGKNFLHGFTASLVVFVDERAPLAQPSSTPSS